MMGKTEELNRLFDIWKKRQSESSVCRKQYFLADGIVDETIFEKEPVRVLFITNEANTKYESHESTTADRREDFRQYMETGKDVWRGKMRLRMSELYKAATGNQNMEAQTAAGHFAVMNLNKSGGSNHTDIQAMKTYCAAFQDLIAEEIRIIDPDLILWCGHGTFFLAVEYLHAEGTKDGSFFFPVGKRKVPLLPIWHTSCYQGKNEPAPGYKDRTIGKQVAKLQMEMQKNSATRRLLEKENC